MSLVHIPLISPRNVHEAINVILRNAQDAGQISVVLNYDCEMGREFLEQVSGRI